MKCNGVWLLAGKILCGSLALCLVTPAAAQARCSPPTGKVLAHTAQVVLYTHKVKVQDGRQVDAFASRFRTGATKAFVNPADLLAQYDVEVPRVTVAIDGLFAEAVVDIGTGSRCCGPQVVVIDLGSSHPKVSFDGEVSHAAGAGNPSSLVLSSTGKVAWIVNLDYTIPSRGPWEVIEGAGKSKLRVLDKSRKISPRSLRLNGSTLSWVDAGNMRTSML